jgi:hypothetical protein
MKKIFLCTKWSSLQNVNILKPSESKIIHIFLNSDFLLMEWSSLQKMLGNCIRFVKKKNYLQHFVS